MNKHTFRYCYTPGHEPSWPCPRQVCDQGHLIIVKDGVAYYESHESTTRQLFGVPDPEDEFGPYSMTLRCIKCHETVLVVGRHTVEEWEFEDEYRHVPVLFPKFFHPTIPLIRITDTCPVSIREALIQAFTVYWSSPGNAANSIRIALERLMDEQNIAGGKLHRRIAVFGQTHPETSEFLEAAKWVGNVGSHEGEVTHEQVLDVLELVEHAIEVLYPKDTTRLRDAAKKIIAAKGKA